MLMVYEKVAMSGVGAASTVSSISICTSENAKNQSNVPVKS